MRRVRNLAFVLLVLLLVSSDRATVFACGELCGEDSGVCGELGAIFDFHGEYDYGSFCQAALEYTCGGSGYCDSWGGVDEGECQNIGGCTTGNGWTVCLNNNVICKCYWRIPCMN